MPGIGLGISLLSRLVSGQEENGKNFGLMLILVHYYSIFDDKVAEVLDIDLITGEKVLAVVGDGSFIPVYLHTAGIRIGDDEFGMKIGFSSKLGVGFSLLGMDVFDRYRVIFDNRAKKVIFETYE